MHWPQLPPYPLLRLSATCNHTYQLSQKKSTGSTSCPKFSASVLRPTASHSCSLPGALFSSPHLVPADSGGLFPWILIHQHAELCSLLALSGLWPLPLYKDCLLSSPNLSGAWGMGLPCLGINSDIKATHRCFAVYSSSP